MSLPSGEELQPAGESPCGIKTRGDDICKKQGWQHGAACWRG
jgi:hypothetical protein